ncbi:MAG: bifunctional DNA-binding transcriptional regulator/O6-methylguanine-DNA methyltransferase Ada [Acidobacteriia bacterium]|nr:bifunctional DNA-binding transcriptional regulator/O6-methylguanine-DNA methyltransferase Ada [Terriglobia bacterium]
MKSANEESRWHAVVRRDRKADGSFFFGVLTTGIYCRPSCPARRPLRRNVRFFDSPRDAERAGLRACKRCKPTDASAGNSRMVQDLCRYIEANADEKITLDDLGRFAGISRFHLQRIFTAELGISPAKYQQACRFGKFKGALRSGSVTTAWTEAGYSSSSRVYESASARLGMTPSRYRQGAQQQKLRFTTFNTPLGGMMLVAGEAGVCSVQFIEESRVARLLKSEYPNAVLTRDDAGLKNWARQVRELVAGDKVSHEIPLDIRGTAFQQKVWQQLQRIPSGETRTYTEVAEAMGRRSAVRAVATACASNRLAIVVPCHRVIHKDGGSSGYRWGTQRKQQLLQKEASH